MSKTIAINAGSSSLKWQLYEMPEEKVVAKGLIERIGLKDSISTVKFDGQEDQKILDIDDHVQAVKILLDDLTRLHIIESFDEITGIGHRVVAGGTYFPESIVITDDVLEKIEELSLIAPLHNPANAQGIRAFREILPEVTAVAVFDTAFHTTMPAKAYRYPMAEKYFVENKVRKYGAHGTSHQYVAKEAARVLGRPESEVKVITAHIGNGVSITAVEGGKSIDTSMGFTPLAGVMMGTRTGDIDPAIIPYLMQYSEDFKDAKSIDNVLNRQSGLLGVSEKSNDMRDIIAGKNAGDEKCTLAYELFIDRIVKYIGQYLAVLGGADAVVFTAGIGENASDIRRDIMKHFTWAGAGVDDVKNETRPFAEDISTADATLRTLVIPTDEELMIARDVERLK